MPVNLASPGILIKEVDLTTGRVDPTTDKMGAIVGVFEKGPVGTPVLVQNENDLLNVFGKPYTENNQYETWFVASSYLAYGGSLRVVRADNTNLKNARFSITDNTADNTKKIKSLEDYNASGHDTTVISNIGVIAKYPGTWGNSLRVSIIDGFGDQILTMAPDHALTAGGSISQIITIDISGSDVTGTLKGIVTKVDTNDVTVKVIYFTPNNGTETNVDYNSQYKFKISTAFTGTSKQATAEKDWFNSQTLKLGTDRKINWSSIVPKPGTTAFAESKGARHDELHIVVIDEDGLITGDAGTILEKHIGLSKAKDAEFSSGSPQYWRKYLAAASEYIYGGNGSEIVTSLVPSTTETGANWDVQATGAVFKVCGPVDLELTLGYDYDGENTGTSSDRFQHTLADISGGYEIFGDGDVYDVDFLLMGSGSMGRSKTQALAQNLIAIAGRRKDAIAFISPSYDTQLSNNSPLSDASTITENVKTYYSPLTSSSYGVFDSGYKYMYDRFNDKFRYIPLNGDIAGLCARNDINNFPWFSPAGTVRGGILNAIKLSYNPTQIQRDELYNDRINPVIFSPGAGIVLFGDKTGLGKSSAFDRINVRRLFIYLEDAIGAAAKDALFEFNDEITRANFVNEVEPFLRDVQAKRGITDYVVICDETNNTASVIDSNEFVADIYVKPARSINFIGLTFIATKTGVNFEEVIGNF